MKAMRVKIIATVADLLLLDLCEETVNILTSGRAFLVEKRTFFGEWFCYHIQHPTLPDHEIKIPAHLASPVR